MNTANPGGEIPIMSKPRWKVPILAVAAVFAATATGCGDNSVDQAVKGKESDKGATASKASVPAPKSIKAQGKLTTCMDVSFPPMEFYEGSNTKKPIGFDVDLMNAVAGTMDVKADFTPTSFDGLLPSLSSSRCDVVASGLFVTDERTKSFPAVPYLRSSRVLLVKDGNPDGIKSPDDLAGKTAATQSGTEYAKSLKKLNAEFAAAGKEKMRLQTYPKASDAVQQVVVGRANAALTQDTEAAYRIATQPGSFEIAYRYPASDVFGAYHRSDEKELGQALESALGKLRDDGTLAKLAAKYKLPEDGVRP
jgi:polar amino acid transport system substrate-binding protein